MSSSSASRSTGPRPGVSSAASSPRAVRNRGNASARRDSASTPATPVGSSGSGNSSSHPAGRTVGVARRGAPAPSTADATLAKDSANAPMARHGGRPLHLSRQSLSVSSLTAPATGAPSGGASARSRSSASRKDEESESRDSAHSLSSTSSSPSPLAVRRQSAQRSPGNPARGSHTARPSLNVSDARNRSLQQQQQQRPSLSLSASAPSVPPSPPPLTSSATAATAPSLSPLSTSPHSAQQQPSPPHQPPTPNSPVASAYARQRRATLGMLTLNGAAGGAGAPSLQPSSPPETPSTTPEAMLPPILSPKHAHSLPAARTASRPTAPRVMPTGSPARSTARARPKPKDPRRPFTETALTSTAPAQTAGVPSRATPEPVARESASPPTQRPSPASSSAARARAVGSLFRTVSRAKPQEPVPFIIDLLRQQQQQLAGASGAPSDSTAGAQDVAQPTEPPPGSDDSIARATTVDAPSAQRSALRVPPPPPAHRPLNHTGSGVAKAVEALHRRSCSSSLLLSPCPDDDATKDDLVGQPSQPTLHSSASFAFSRQQSLGATDGGSGGLLSPIPSGLLGVGVPPRTSNNSTMTLCSAGASSPSPGTLSLQSTLTHLNLGAGVAMAGFPFSTPALQAFGSRSSRASPQNTPLVGRGGGATSAFTTSHTRNNARGDGVSSVATQPLDEASHSDMSSVFSVNSVDIQEFLCEFRAAKEEVLADSSADKDCITVEELARVLERVAFPLLDFGLVSDLFDDLAAAPPLGSLRDGAFAVPPAVSSVHSTTASSTGVESATSEAAAGHSAGRMRMGSPMTPGADQLSLAHALSAHSHKSARGGWPNASAVAPADAHAAAPPHELDDAAADAQPDGAAAAAQTVDFEALLARMAFMIQGRYPTEVIRTAYYRTLETLTASCVRGGGPLSSPQNTVWSTATAAESEAGTWADHTHYGHPSPGDHEDETEVFGSEQRDVSQADTVAALASVSSSSRQNQTPTSRRHQRSQLSSLAGPVLGERSYCSEQSGCVSPPAMDTRTASVSTPGELAHTGEIISPSKWRARSPPHSSSRARDDGNTEASSRMKTVSLSSSLQSVSGTSSLSPAWPAEGQMASLPGVILRAAPGSNADTTPRERAVSCPGDNTDDDDDDDDDDEVDSDGDDKPRGLGERTVPPQPPAAAAGGVSLLETVPLRDCFTIGVHRHLGFRHFDGADGQRALRRAGMPEGSLDLPVALNDFVRLVHALTLVCGSAAAAVGTGGSLYGFCSHGSGRLRSSAGVLGTPGACVAPVTPPGVSPNVNGTLLLGSLKELYIQHQAQPLAPSTHPQ